jgi:hypothetical protein
MFESLDDTMKHDAQKETTPKERMMRWAMTAIVSVAVVGGLLFAIRMME